MPENYLQARSGYPQATGDAPFESLRDRAGHIASALKETHRLLDRLTPSEAPELMTPKLPEEPGLEWLVNEGRNEATRLRERVERLTQLVGRL